MFDFEFDWLYMDFDFIDVDWVFFVDVVDVVSGLWLFLMIVGCKFGYVFQFG